jgi:Pentapeptide repeats (8 copies)
MIGSTSKKSICDADLSGENLERADLGEANLSGANLAETNLDGAHLEHANLTLAHLHDAHLNGAHLNGADLTLAHLTGAHLTGAQLDSADLSDANVADADLDFDPDSPPKVFPGIYTARNLPLIKFSDQPVALVKLRGEFKGMGLRTQESQLTYAIRRSELNRKGENEDYVHSWFERAFNTVFFDWTCQYGMSPGRPLLLVVGFGGFFTVVYTFAQCFPSLGGIWVVWDENRIDKTKGDYPSQRLTGFPYDPSARPRSRVRFCLSVVMLGAYFSLLSALRIGWSGLNFGTWITRM